MPTLSDANLELPSSLGLASTAALAHFFISLAPSDLIAVGGPAPYATFFSNGNGEMRIINAVGTGNLNGEPIAAQLGIDNIRAVPEPTTTAFLGTGMVLLAARLFRAKCRP